MSTNSHTSSAHAAVPAPRRGRPRDDARRIRVLEAAMRVAWGDPRRVTFERIASEAKVSRTTLYRWWAGPHELLLDALLESTRWSLAHTHGTAHDRLRDQVADLVRIMTDPTTSGIVRFLASGSAADPDTRHRYADRWLEPRRAVAARILRDGVDAGEVRADVDPQVIIDALFSPVYHRAFFTDQRLDEGVADAVVRLVWPGISTRG